MVYGWGCGIIHKFNLLITSTGIRLFWILLSTIKFNGIPSLENLAHFVTAISTLLRHYVMDIVMNIESLKCHFMSRGNYDEFELPSQER
jgi:hypothetical protein